MYLREQSSHFDIVRIRYNKRYDLYIKIRIVVSIINDRLFTNISLISKITLALNLFYYCTDVGRYRRKDQCYFFHRIPTTVMHFFFPFCCLLLNLLFEFSSFCQVVICLFATCLTAKFFAFHLNHHNKH